jgi:hypothetical protein
MVIGDREIIQDENVYVVSNQGVAESNYTSVATNVVTATVWTNYTNLSNYSTNISNMLYRFITNGDASSSNLTWTLYTNLSNMATNISNYFASTNFQQVYFFNSLFTNTFSTNATNFSHQNKWFTPTNLTAGSVNALSNILPAGSYEMCFTANMSGANAASVIQYAFVTNGGIVSNSVMEFNTAVANDLMPQTTQTFVTIPANCRVEVQCIIITPGATGNQFVFTRPQLYIERKY